jgi:hypothetical protein
MLKIVNSIEVREVNGQDPDPAGTDRPSITVESHPLNEDWSIICIGEQLIADRISARIAVKTDDLRRACENSANRGTSDFDDHMKKYGLKQPF